MKKISLGVILFILIVISISPATAVYVACTNGTAATLNINWTFTGAPGTMALVTNVGTEQNALLDFVIPQGNTGATGANGTSGGVADLSNYLPLNGTSSMTGDLSLDSHSITGVITGVAGSNAANKSYVDSHSSNYNASYWTGTNFNASYWTGTNYNSSYWTGTNYNATYAANSNYNASYVTYNNGSYVLTSNLSYALDSEVTAVNDTMRNYVNATNTSMKNYVDGGLPYIGINNQSIILAGNTSFVSASNTSLLLTSNTSIATTTYVGNVNTSMKNYVDGKAAPDLTSFLFINGTRAMTGNLSMGSQYINSLVSGKLGTDAVNKSYVDSVASTYNATYDAKTNYNSSYWTGTNYNSSYATTTYVGDVNTSMKNYVDGKAAPDLTPFLFINGTRAMTGNLSMGSKYINGVITGIGSDAVNRTYVDSGLPYVSSTNASIILAGNTSFVAANNASLLLTSNTSVATTTYVSSVNTSMKNYVDAGLPYVAANNQSIILAGNGSFVAATNASLLLTSNTSIATTTYVNNANTSMKNYVDAGLPYVASSNQSIILAGNTSFVSSGNQSIILAGNTSFVAATNSSLVTTANTTYLLTGGSMAMTGNLSLGSKSINLLVSGNLGTDAVNKSYVDSVASTYNATYDAKTNYNASYWTGTNYNSSYITSTFNSTYDAKNNYNASYWTGTNYNASYLSSDDDTPYLFINGTRAMTGNLSMGSKYINSVITGNLGTDAVNRSYVDSGGLPYVAASNASLLLTTNTSVATTTYVNAVDHSMYLFLNGTRGMTGNLTMGGKSITGIVTGVGADAVNRTYVDSGLPYVSSTNASIILAGNTSFVAATNSSLLLTSNTSVATTTYVTSVNTSMKNYVDASNTSMKNYVDGGLPYVAANNASIILAGNTSFVSSTNQSIILAGNTTFVATTNSSLVTTGNSTYVLTGGSRAMTGNLSMGSQYINSLISGKQGSDAVNKSYVDSVASTYNATYDAKTNYNASYWTGTNYNASYLTSDDDTPYLFINGTRAMTGNLSMGSKYINSVITGNLGTDAVNRSYIDAGLPYVSSSNQSIIVSGNTSFVAATNASLVLTGNTSYILNNGQRAMAANLSMGSYYINNLITGTPGASAVNRSYVDSGLPYVASSNTSIITAGNTSFVAATNTSLVLTSNTTYPKNPVTSYITLMAGSSMIPTTNPANMDQAETAVGNNYIYTEFTDGGSENSQWIVDMPNDWDSAHATNGKLTFYFLWTTTGGGAGQTVKFDIAGKLLPDDSAINTAPAAVGTATDTWTAAGDMYVSPATTAAVITSAGTGGQTAIFKVTRDSGTDTLGATARLIGVRVGYIRTLA